jgi:hypothetical protein
VDGVLLDHHVSWHEDVFRLNLIITIELILLRGVLTQGKRIDFLIERALEQTLDSFFSFELHFIFS